MGNTAREAYLDIETTGLSRSRAEITVIGVAVCCERSRRVRQLVGGEITADALIKTLKGVETIFTYNGSRFDLPFIKAQLGVDLGKLFQHRDLMYDCWKQKLKGGLKVVESKLGIGRQVEGVDGFMAVRLWWRYVNDDDRKALRTLLAYNREDVVNLQLLRDRLGVA